MMTYRRYGLYFVPQHTALAELGHAWMGWNSLTGVAASPPDLPGLPLPATDITETPRKYGFHGTVQPPFLPAPEAGNNGKAYRAALADRLAHHAPVALGHLTLTRLGRFLALIPAAPCPALQELAAEVIRTGHPFRLPPSEADLARRRKSRLTPRQDDMLTRWGYPYVMEEFRFHLTLTSRLPKPDGAQVEEVLSRHFARALREPLTITELALVGEDELGRFHVLEHLPLGSAEPQSR